MLHRQVWFFFSYKEFEKKNRDYDECFMWGGEGRNMYKYGRK